MGPGRFSLRGSARLAETLKRSRGELLRTRSSHDGHFLERTLRLDGAELERAMRLYHHSALLRQQLADMMQGRSRDRAAIALSEGRGAAHVIVSRDGGFVTCLAPSMCIGDLPVLPYAPLCAAMDRADAEHKASVRRKQQFERLPPARLMSALLEGPGHVTREMVEVIEIDPQSYLIALGKRFYQNLEAVLHCHDLCQEFGMKQPIWREVIRLEGSLTLCFFLFGLMDVPFVTTMLCQHLKQEYHSSDDILSALARHRSGGGELLGLLGEIDKPWLRQSVQRALISHAFHHPRSIPELAARILSLPQLGHGPLADHLGALARADPARLERDVSRTASLLMPLRPEVADRLWLPTPRELLQHALRRLPVSALFPPEARAGDVRAAWNETRRSIKMPEEKKVRGEPVRRASPKVGRNDPCPCRSGRKYKHCCERKGDLTRLQS